MSQRKPLIGITGDYIKVRDVMPAAAAYEVYSLAVANGAGGLPWIIPPLGRDLDLAAIVERMDGIVFTGARSNVQPRHYDGGPAPDNSLEDPARDSTTLPLIPMVLAAGKPMLCICRGMQELNVALGGTLATEIQELPGRIDHRAPVSDAQEARFAIRHPIQVRPGGLLHSIVKSEVIDVNSLHRQAIDRLAPGLRVEATASDGTIEAVSAGGPSRFVLGVQWHPEYWFRRDAASAAIFAAFGDAVRGFVAAKG